MKATIYFHGDRYGMREDFKELHEPELLDLTSEAIDEAMLVGYEVQIDGDWNLYTGKFMATHLMGTKLESPVEI
tara:strand:+ start:136 stop:357 length:222 start_codon:yes stop_codon:yes gene_type:complete